MVNKKAGDKANEEVAGKAGTGVVEQAGMEVDKKDDLTDTDENPVTAGTEHADGQLEKPGPRRSWGAVLFLTALVIIAAGATGYLVIDIRKSQSANVAGVQSLAARLETLQRTTASLSEENQLFHTRLARTNERVAELLNNFSSLYQQGNSDVGWQLAEIKYLFLGASQRLALERDVDTALAVLQTADTKLKEIADPALFPVREQLIADINRLKAAPRTDFAGVALLLGDLAGQVEQFPLNLDRIDAEAGAPAGADPAPAEQKWKQLGRALWQEIKTLIVVSRTDKNSAVLLPQERYFLYQNLRLQLETARLAVLLRDYEQFQASVSAGKDWLEDYFDTGDTRVGAAIDSLGDAAAVDFHGVVPSIDRSLRALEAYSTRQTRAMIGTGAQR